MANYTYVTEKATHIASGWSNKEVALFHYLNPNGFYQQKKAIDTQVRALVDAGLAKSGALIAYGGLNHHYADKLVALATGKYVRRADLLSVLEGLSRDNIRATEWIAEVELEAAKNTDETPTAKENHMDAQTPSTDQILAQILPYSLGPDFAPDTLHGHGIGWTIKEWPRGPHGASFKSFRSTPLPVPAPFDRCFKEVCLSGEIGQTPEGYDEFPVSVSLSWVSHGSGTNGVEIGTFFFRPQTGVLFAHRLASNNNYVEFV